jgi:hypothetical protein
MPSNPLHDLIILLDQLLHAFRQVHQASTEEARDQAEMAWEALTGPFWQRHRFPMEAHRALADPILAWCRRNGFDSTDHVVTVGQAITFLTNLARCHPIACVALRSRSSEVRREWERQLEIHKQALKMWDNLRELAALTGEPWPKDGHLPQEAGTAPAPRGGVARSFSESGGNVKFTTPSSTEPFSMPSPPQTTDQSEPIGTAPGGEATLPDPIKPLSDCISALAAERPTAHIAAACLAEAVEQVRRLVAPSIPSSWLNPRLAVFERACGSWLAEAAGTPIRNEELTVLRRVLNDLQPASTGRYITWDSSRVNAQNAYLHALGVREAIRPTSWPPTKEEQNHSALIHLKLLEMELNPDGLPRDRQGNYSVHFVINRALVDLRDICYEIAEHWGYMSLWNRETTATAPPLEMPDLPSQVIERLIERVERLGGALSQYDVPTGRLPEDESQPTTPKGSSPAVGAAHPHGGATAGQGPSPSEVERRQADNETGNSKNTALNNQREPAAVPTGANDPDDEASTNGVDWQDLLLSPPLTASEIADKMGEPAADVERILRYFRQAHDYGFIKDDDAGFGEAVYRYKMPEVMTHLQKWHAKRQKKAARKNKPASK